MAYPVILSATFAASVTKTSQIPVTLNTLQDGETRLTQWAMLGRSNVGKSSLINAMIKRKDLAHTSNTPGKTRRIHIYNIVHTFKTSQVKHPNRLLLFDFPGYGYAKISKQEQAAWKQDLEAFLLDYPAIDTYFLLVDTRHGLLPNDLQMLEFLQHYQKPVRMVLTKWDKCKHNERMNCWSQTSAQLNQLGFDPAQALLAVSSKSRHGLDALWGIL